METQNIRLTQFAHGAGCGCKIAPQVLDSILQTNATQSFPALLVGNSSKDDAAVYQLNNTEALISTTDFFTPIVDDAYTFGQVAAANAISDVYAMGGTPIMALAILGWPVDKLPATLAQQVLEGARNICQQAGIPLAGGHSIDTPEPVFGLSVNGKVTLTNLKKNNTVNEGDVLLLTKPIGVGILATAAKRDVLLKEHVTILHHQLTQLNKIGEALGSLLAVTALTDVTGFGLLGHVIEMAEGSKLSVSLDYNKIPILPQIQQYLAQNVVPDATYRNWNGYSTKVKFEIGVNVMEAFKTLPDPQTNGGLLIAVNPTGLQAVQDVLIANGYPNFIQPIGVFTSEGEKRVVVMP
jgi:selenide, water dikinase